MALKDKLTDLENFKYGISSPDKVDAQIRDGVDFFPNEDGGAVGFTPKVDLETKYNKFMKSVKENNTLPNQYQNQANILAPNSGLRINTKTRSAYGIKGEYIEAEGVGISSPPGNHVLEGDNINPPKQQPQFLSDFLVNPISDYVSNYNPPGQDSLTLSILQHTSTGPTQFTITGFNDTPKIPNAHRVGEDWGYNLPEQKSSGGGAQIPIINDKRRGVFDHLQNTFFENQPIPINQPPNSVFEPTYSRFFAENNGKSIHISPAGELKAGLRYKGLFGGANNGVSLTDSLGSIWPDAVTVYPKERFQTFDNYSQNYETYTSKLVLPEDTFFSTYPDAAPTGLSKQSSGVLTSFGTDLTDLKLRGEEATEQRDFGKTPAGYNENFNFETKPFREVASRGPFEGKNNQPFILREIGNNWGIDDFPANPLSDFIGEFIPGAPGLSGYISRVVNDRVRIGKFLFNTSEGFAFLGKQAALQALNPTLETKIFNPLSPLSIVGANDLINAFRGNFDGSAIAALGSSITSLFFQVGHPERHLGGGRYEPIILATNDGNGRLSYQSQAFAIDKIPDVPAPQIPKVNIGGVVGSTINSLTGVVNKKVEKFTDTLNAAEAAKTLALSNPNKYIPILSSAPVSIGKDGRPSFHGGPETALKDVIKATKTDGQVFKKETAVQESNKDGLIKRHATLSYDKLKFKYENNPNLNTPLDIAKFDGKITLSAQEKLALSDERLRRREAKIINDGLGKVISDFPIEPREPKGMRELQFIKGNISSANVDSINILPLLHGEEKPKELTDDLKRDFIKFNFHNVVNNKWIVFRAILDGISDSISPEYSSVRYLGRPDNLYTYVGTDRSISFGFKIIPKTKQEFPVLMEKLNYLVGLCYPSYTEEQRMITPFMELTIGDMFVETPGYLNSLSVTVEDSSNWEIQDKLQFPHFISAQCEFTHVGKYVPHNLGKHYDIDWLDDYRLDGKRPLGTFKQDDHIIPTRKSSFAYINALTEQKNPEPTTAE